jgi:acyl carrier protein
MSLTGSEMNHPNKVNDTLFNTVKNINDVITFNIKTNFNISDGEFQQIKSILNNCNSVNDLSKYFIDSETSVE